MKNIIQFKSFFFLNFKISSIRVSYLQFTIYNVSFIKTKQV